MIIWTFFSLQGIKLRVLHMLSLHFSECTPSFMQLEGIRNFWVLALSEFIKERTEQVCSLTLQAIFELSQGEEDLIEDLKLAKKVS